MEVVSHLYGGAPVIKRYPIAASASRIGVPWLMPASNGAGLAIGTTTGLDSFVGINLDTATYNTAQQTGAVDPQELISVDIRPDQIIKIRLSGGATDGTALTLRSVITANTDGLTVTTTSSDDWGSPTMDEGVIWYVDGTNSGHRRKITSVSSNVATVTTAFPRDDVAGERVAYAPVFPFQANTITLTTNLLEFRQDSAVATNTGAFRCIDISELVDLANDGQNKSFARFISGNHVGHIAT